MCDDSDACRRTRFVQNVHRFHVGLFDSRRTSSQSEAAISWNAGLVGLLDSKTDSTIATSIVHSKLDYCKSLFLNLDSAQIHRLQLIQNSLARTVTRTPSHHITLVRKTHH